MCPNTNHQLFTQCLHGGFQMLWFASISAVFGHLSQLPNGNYVLGNEPFKQEIAVMLKRRVVPPQAGRSVKSD